VIDPERAAARALVLRHGWNSVSYQILNPGMQLWFSAAGDAVAGYAKFGHIRVVAGAPVCRPERLSAVAEELESHANASGDRILFFGAGTRLEAVYADRPDHCLAHLGAQPIWNPGDWPATVRGKASLRAQLHRARNKGVEVAEWPPERSRGAPALRCVLNEWLATRGLPPMGFLVMPDLVDHVQDRRLFVATRAGDVVAYLVATPVPARHGWLVEQWPRTSRAPNGTTHLLVDAAMRGFAESGSRYATLGLAPLSEFDRRTRRGEPFWLRATMGWLRAHGRRFYNFRGLEAFKASLQPLAWEPVFVIAQGRRFTPAMLRAVAGVFSGRSPERFIGGAMLSAVAEELARIRRRW
jgi:phosphatidylglycerol lysyltransferase